MVELISAGKRADGRGLNDLREIKIENGPIVKAQGSSWVHLGDTEVLVGVKLETGTPFPDTPDEGALTVNAEFVPLAHELFEPGPPDEDSIELSRVVDRGIRESKTLDLKGLAVVRGKKVFVVFIDVYILNHDGNLIDAAGWAAMSALMNAKIKGFEVNDQGEIKFTGESRPLPLRDYPIPITIAKVNDKMIVDPNIDEELMTTAKITITTNSKGEVCALQKSGLGTLTSKEVLEAQRISRAKGEEIRQLLLKAKG